jgi:phosphatidylethanolamine/phosphatidyl-N-methylethanolamine N-methyltransferase
MSVRYDLSGQQKAYAVWAGFYDTVYIRLLADAQRRLAATAAACGPNILEVGVGTGLVLRYYPSGTRVVGVDLSEPMLRKAVDKVAGEGLRHIAGVAAMDACRLGLPDRAFDAVCFPFVVTLVPDPEGALDEAARVLRPGGEIIVASKLGADTGAVARIEGIVAPLAKAVGWSSDFKLSRLTNWAARRGDFELVEVRPVFPAGFFKLVRLRKRAAA